MGEKPQPVFVALADPTRRALLLNLAQAGPKTATGLAREHPGMTRQGLLKHLNVLAAAGLVTTRREGREQHFHLNPAPLDEVERFVRVAEQRWAARLERLKRLAEKPPD
jgi:DNA-binding transcriptional ArsR family regulator